MIGIVAVSHAGLARELLQASELIIGPLERVEAVSIDRGMSVDVAKKQLQQAVSKSGTDGDGVLIFTDLFGGTPTNISVEFLSGGGVEILAGVNLPMLIKSISARNSCDIDELAKLLKEYGKNAIMRPSELLGQV